MKSSPAWHRNARAARASARRASHRGDIVESQLWRILNHHVSEMTKNARQLWCVKCSSWANGTLLLFESLEDIFRPVGSSMLLFPVYSPLLPSPCLFHRHRLCLMSQSSQAFTVTRCHLWLTGDEFRVCAASTWFISARIRPCGSKCCIVRTTSARDLSPVILTGPTPDNLFFSMSTCANLTQHAWARCIMADLHNVHARRVTLHLHASQLICNNSKV